LSKCSGIAFGIAFEFPMARTIHVCHLGKYYPPAPGGIETHVQTLARAQADAGARVRVLCVNHSNSSGRDVTWAPYGATPTVEDRDGPVRILRLGRSATFARLDICPELPRAIDDLFDEPVDILHLHTPNPTMVLAVTRLRKTAAIVVTHHSDIIKQRILRYALGPFERMVYGRAVRLVVTSDAYRDGSELLTRYREKVVTLPMGLDLTAMLQPSQKSIEVAADWKQNYGGQAGAPIWLSVGRLVYYKGLDTAIAALSNVPGTLIIIGRGPMEEELKALALRLGVADRIVWRGYADGDELIGAYLASTALWFPSSHRSEAYGLVQVEAMAAGCPVINTFIPHSGVSWVSRHEESGLTIPVGDAAALAEASRRIAADPALRARLSAGARARAIVEFDARLMATRSLDLYSSVLETRRPVPELKLSEWVQDVNRATSPQTKSPQSKSPQTKLPVTRIAGGRATDG
jgi:glycosyltransferase involved in cell wall biosynthesis